MQQRFSLSVLRRPIRHRETRQCIEDWSSEGKAASKFWSMSLWMATGHESTWKVLKGELGQEFMVKQILGSEWQEKEEEWKEHELSSAINGEKDEVMWLKGLWSQGDKKSLHGEKKPLKLMPEGKEDRGRLKGWYWEERKPSPWNHHLASAIINYFDTSIDVCNP